MKDKEFDILLEKTVREHADEYFVTPPGEDHAFPKEFDENILKLAKASGKKKTGRLLKIIIGFGTAAAAAAVAFAVFGSGMLQSWTSAPVRIEEEAANSAAGIAENNMQTLTPDGENNSASAASTESSESFQNETSDKSPESRIEYKAEEKNSTGRIYEGKLADEFTDSIGEDTADEPGPAQQDTAPSENIFDDEAKTNKAPDLSPADEQEFQAITNNSRAADADRSLLSLTGADISAVIFGKDAVISDGQADWLISYTNDIIADENLIVDRIFTAKQKEKFRNDGVFVLISSGDESSAYNTVTILADQNEGYVITGGSGVDCCYMIPDAPDFFSRLAE